MSNHVNIVLLQSVLAKYSQLESLKSILSKIYTHSSNYKKNNGQNSSLAKRYF